MPSSSAEIQINAVIVGAQKCATTSLGHYLAQHPEVCLPRSVVAPGTPHPFDRPRSLRPQEIDGWQGERIILQKRPAWLYGPEYPRNIAAHNPEAKIIVVLRNQADRAFAHWRHNLRKGREMRSFAGALAHEPARIGRSAYFRQHFSYLDRGHYSAQLDRFAEAFPRQQILLFDFDQLVRTPQEVCRRTFEFLGLEPTAVRTEERFNENPFEVRTAALAWPLYALNFVMTERSRRLHSLRNRLQGRFNLRRAAERPRIDEALKQDIMRRFEADNAALAHDWGIHIH